MEFFIIIVGLIIYFIPIMVAYNNRNASTVFLINLFLGWSVIGWIVALVMAFADSKESVVIETSKSDKYDQLQKLDELRIKGVITTEEFIREKEKVMKA